MKQAVNCQNSLHTFHTFLKVDHLPLTLSSCAFTITNIKCEASATLSETKAGHLKNLEVERKQNRDAGIQVDS